MHESPTLPMRHSGGQAQLAIRFFLAAVVFGLASGVICWGLARRFGKSCGVASPAFAVSTALLWSGSFALSRALEFVRREKQAAFRRSLKTALVLGVLFTGVQAYALWSILPTTAEQRTPESAELGAVAYVMMFGSVHALHFALAVLFVLLITLRAAEDRYDHEYHWGVTLCTWFWHGLGVVWMAILLVLYFAHQTRDW